MASKVVQLEITNKTKCVEICRTCSCEIKNDDDACEIENNPAKPDLPLLLKRYVPGLDMKVENKHLCIDCVSTLYLYHNFKRKCLRMEEDLRLHKRKHPQVEKLDLNDVFGSKDIVKAETKKITSNNSRKASTMQCDLCSLSFSSESLLKVHQAKYHSAARYQCDKCGRTFTLKSLYTQHLAYHKRPQSDRFMCKICNFVYHSSLSLNKHTLTEHDTHKIDCEKQFQCELCGRKFIEKHMLTVHMRTHVDGATDTTKAANNVICNDCGRIFLSKKSLLLHIRAFHGRERHQCNQCGRVFSSKSLYARHTAYHGTPNADDYKCKVCNFVYKSYGSLRDHFLSRHSSDQHKLFQCEQCAMRFAYQSKLDAHMRMHTGEKPYKCSLCEYSSRCSTALNKHFRAKHSEKQ